MLDHYTERMNAATRAMWDTERLFNHVEAAVKAGYDADDCLRLARDVTERIDGGQSIDCDAYRALARMSGLRDY